MKNLLLVKVAAVLDCIAASPRPVSLKELSARLDLPAATLSRITADLCEMGVIEKSGYHSFVPGISAFRLCERARDNNPLCRAADKFLKPFAQENGLSVLLTGVEKQTIFTVFSFLRSPAPQKPVWATGAALMLFAACRMEWEEALTHCLAEKPDMSATEKIVLGQEFAAARRDWMLFRIQQLRQWSLSLPLHYRTTPCVLTVFGSVPVQFDNVRFETECRRLLSRLTSAVKTGNEDEK